MSLTFMVEETENSSLLLSEDRIIEKPDGTRQRRLFAFDGGSREKSWKKLLKFLRDHPYLDLPDNLAPIRTNNGCHSRESGNPPPALDSSE